MHHEIPSEKHYVHRAGWLRAAVLGANDGLVSTASLIMGIAASNASTESIFLAGLAGLVAGSMAMAAGEYVSVSSQSDIENADLERERLQHVENPQAELNHLADIYVERGLTRELAREVAKQLSEHDALGTHAREELGISEHTTAQPLQAAIASAMSFAFGAILPLLVIFIAPPSKLMMTVVAVTTLLLMMLGFMSAKAGGARPLRPIMRITFWGLAAMAATAIVGYLFGANVV